MNEYLKKAFAENDVNFINNLEVELIENIDDRKLVECVQHHNEVCAVKILKDYGKDLMLYYMKICTDYDKKKYDLEMEKYLKKNN